MQLLIPIIFATAATAQLMGADTTGIFTAGKSMPNFSLTSLTSMIGPVLGMTADTTGGTGPYKAGQAPVLAELPKQTIFKPKSVPQDVKLPVILWGNGLCAGRGSWFSKFLVEIASHGYFIMALGAPNGTLTDKTLATDMPNAIDWVYKNAGKGEYTYLDKANIAAAGQSCGGLQAYSASVDPRITLTGLFNSGMLNPDNAKLLEKLHAPVGFFLGGPTDVAYENGERDYKIMPSKIPVVKANLNVGHMATYGDANGGKFGKAAVAFFDWQLKGNQTAAKLFLDPESSALTKDGWQIQSRGFSKV